MKSNYHPHGATCFAKVSIGVLALVVIFGTQRSALAQSRFDVIREQVDPSPDNPYSNSSSGSGQQSEMCEHGELRNFCSHCCDDDDHHDLATMLGYVAGGIIVGVTVGSVTYLFDHNLFTESKKGRSIRDTSYAYHPYADGYPGYLIVDDLGDYENQYGALQSRFYWMSNFDGVQQWSATGFAETPIGLGIHSQYSFFTESIPGRVTDELQFADANLLMRIGWNETAVFRAGLGMNWLQSQTVSDFGVNSTFLFDFYPHEPLILSAQFDLGKVGDASTNHIEATIGWSWEFAEAFIGYDRRKVGTVTLEGPLIGFRFYR